VKFKEIRHSHSGEDRPFVQCSRCCVLYRTCEAPVWDVWTLRVERGNAYRHIYIYFIAHVTLRQY